ncbi:hypothetical protein [Criblamydia sequanensis]|uniref:Membrane protein n=1 Tax=Candidatus Criblamydia sequanensis CRIB-18 TaxID=1437425 RepID=A0A090D0T4_9BACT|nr:hypothetical protein [Criblamydia sequanensis]CDR33480.1 Putative membrane protein [Criblamydia sequanensis CRIB-18]
MGNEFLIKEFIFSVLTGTALMSINMVFIKKLGEAWISKNQKLMAFSLLILLKFPFLYFIGYELLKLEVVQPIGLIVGLNISMLGNAFLVLQKQKHIFIKS